MEDIWLKARAKINLTLDVTGKRPDGYHNLRMIMQTLELYDGVYIKRTLKPEIVVKSNLKWLPVDESNIAFKAARLMKNKFNISDGVFIELNKRIPVAAGLAGGSADAAAVVVGLNKIFNLKIPPKELLEIGLELGSDVPYCIKRGTYLAEGRGEILTRLSPCPEFHVVLAKYPVSVSTASVYKSLKLSEITLRPDTEAMISYISNKNKTAIALGLCNVLESVTVKKYPRIDNIKKFLVLKGAAGSLMSGSGPAVFGLFYEKEKAKTAAKELKETFKLREVYVTQIFNP